MQHIEHLRSSQYYYYFKYFRIFHYNMEKLRQKKTKQLNQSCRECKRWNLDQNARSLAPRAGPQRGTGKSGSRQSWKGRQAPGMQTMLEILNSACKFKDVKERTSRITFTFFKVLLWLHHGEQIRRDKNGTKEATQDAGNPCFR